MVILRMNPLILLQALSFEHGSGSNNGAGPRARAYVSEGEFDGILLDYSPQCATLETMDKLFKLTEAAGLKGKISRMVNGDRVLEKNKADAARFSPFWNEIIKKSARRRLCYNFGKGVTFDAKEHWELTVGSVAPFPSCQQGILFVPILFCAIICHVTTLERELLLMPRNTGNLPLVQWPLFLLASKIFLAKDIALESRYSQEELWDRISRDDYMKYAVEECYCAVWFVLTAILDDEGKMWVEKIYEHIESSIAKRTFLLDFHVDKLALVISRVTALMGILKEAEKPDLHNGAVKAIQDLYDVVHHDVLSVNMRFVRCGNLFLALVYYGIPLLPFYNIPCGTSQKTMFTFDYQRFSSKCSRNLEARRRLEFFTNSLFMNMPPAKLVCEMLSFSVFTPYYSEVVLYSLAELQKKNEDDEWRNFLAQIGRNENLVDSELFDSPSDILELRFWASYQGQTLARTIRGMMYYRKALMLQTYLERMTAGVSSKDAPDTQGFELSPEARAHPDLKFTYVVTCHIYGKQKEENKPEAADIALLMQRQVISLLHVWFIEFASWRFSASAVFQFSFDGRVHTEYYSKLVKADINGKDKEIYSIKLPGNPKLGEGKPENQNHAVIFTRGNAVQTIDMNQDNYFEEALKMRNFLEELHYDHGICPATILGVREHVFTGSWKIFFYGFIYLRLWETRTLDSPRSNKRREIMENFFFSSGDYPLSSGRPAEESSLLLLSSRRTSSRTWTLTPGAPWPWFPAALLTNPNLILCSRSVDRDKDRDPELFHFQLELRKVQFDFASGNVTHHEYIQVGKGRDVGLNQIALFEGKVAGGNGEQVLSQDVYRLGQLFDFFRMMSFYFTTVGYYFCTMLTVLTVYIFLYGKAYLALSGVGEDVQSRAEVMDNAALNAQFLFQIGIFTAVPMILGFILEQGFLREQATGRGFVVRHIRFAENYRLLEVVLLLVVYLAYGYNQGGTLFYILLSLSSWFMALSWLFAPYLFNPSGFEWQKTVVDFRDWTNWLLYRGGVGVMKGQESWEAWWDEELNSNSELSTLSFGLDFSGVKSLAQLLFPFFLSAPDRWIQRNCLCCIPRQAFPRQAAVLCISAKGSPKTPNVYCSFWRFCTSTADEDPVGSGTTAIDSSESSLEPCVIVFHSNRWRLHSLSW
ncbi:hypothetical protein RHGRI_023499 [Rhododendron griersonianum]|uniref:1,3-beta-glucan synthase n=1 Tax=Rhododendron griersonianum TaxID=479676 RepID=A0AAV6J408_9ERIC|nr:hypothetical protein RHGRI_023499 [Rhododendron griersonianum]